MGRVLFLGSGGSAGVPVIGCSCSVCHSLDPKDRRLRPSILFEVEGKKILFDAGPDFRMQALSHHIDHLDGVILTHAHFDHIAGLDDLRIYYVRKKQHIPLLTSQATMEDLRRRFAYLFLKKSAEISLSAQFDFQVLNEERGETFFCGLPFTYFSYEQGGMKVTGFRYKEFAYVMDIRHYPESIFEDLKGVQTLILSSIGPLPSMMHLSFDEARAFAERVQAKECYITHLSHDISHEEGNRFFSNKIQLAYDGLSLEVL